MSLIINTGEITAAAADAYGAYQGGLGNSSNQASFGSAVAAAASTLAASAKGTPFLNGLGTGVAPAASMTQLALNISNLQNAQTPADGMAAALGILGGAAGTLGGLMPPSPLKVTLTGIAIGASTAQLGIQQNSKAVNNLVNDLTKSWDSLTNSANSNSREIKHYKDNGVLSAPIRDVLKNDMALAKITLSPLVLDLGNLCISHPTASLKR